MGQFIPYPLKFKPICKERVWGGSRIEKIYHKGFPLEKPIGESWELCDHAEDASEIVNGPYSGTNIHELMLKFKSELLGANHPEVDVFPVLVKILDPNDKLSIQVHPDEAYVAAHDDVEAPKAEVWYIADANPNAEIIRGVKPGVAKNELVERIGSGTLEQVMNFVTVEKYGVYPIFSGTIHALLPGSLVFEIQQNSDVTFRLYDWGRVGLDGKPRELHVDHGIACTHVKHNDFKPEKIDSETRIIFRAPGFEVLEYIFQGGSRDIKTEAYNVITVVEGSCSLIVPGAEDNSLTLAGGETSVIPAAAGKFTIDSEEGTRLLLTRPG
jgi:mannose-6-phosphate isomerase